MAVPPEDPDPPTFGPDLPTQADEGSSSPQPQETNLISPFNSPVRPAAPPQPAPATQVPPTGTQRPAPAAQRTTPNYAQAAASEYVSKDDFHMAIAQVSSSIENLKSTVTSQLAHFTEVMTGTLPSDPMDISPSPSLPAHPHGNTSHAAAPTIPPVAASHSLPSSSILRLPAPRLTGPTFTGAYPQSRMYREIMRFLQSLQDIFTITNGLPDSHMILMATNGMQEGPAAAWWHTLATSARPRTWQEFQEALFAQFLGPNHRLLVQHRLRNLRQTGTLDYYINEFELLSQQLNIDMYGQDTVTAAADFVMHLTQELREKVMHTPVTTYPAAKELALNLNASLILARTVRDRHTSHSSNISGSSNSASSNFPRPTASFTPSSSNGASNTSRGNHSGASSSTNPRGRPNPKLNASTAQPATHPAVAAKFHKAQASSSPTRLTDEERARRKKLGLCIVCGANEHLTADCPIKKNPNLA